jgi:hypothetical protein
LHRACPILQPLDEEEHAAAFAALKRSGSGIAAASSAEDLEAAAVLVTSLHRAASG